MLLVRTYVAPSKIQGLGLFAAEDIPKGRTVRITREITDIMITPEQFKTQLPAAMREVVDKFSWNDEEGNFHLSFGNEMFINHSTDPTMKLFPGTDEHVAVRDIAKDEEITDDYREYSHKDNTRPWLHE